MARTHNTPQRETPLNRPGGIESSVRSGLRRFSRPVYALPVDLFRIMVGMLSCVYFGHVMWEIDEISAPHGLIDHSLSLELFPYTALSLFHEGISSSQLRFFFCVAILASAALTAGCRPTLAAGILYIVAVSTYRWNYLALYVDDAIVHWTLLWVVLLPTGHTLCWREWRKEGNRGLSLWRQRRVHGLAVRCFLANLAMIYLFAGLWKWTSPMWRDGSALFAILKLPIAWTPHLWEAGHLPWLRVASYLALAIEPLFVLLLVLPPGRAPRWALLGGLAAFHVGIIATLKIPYANLACLAAIVLWARRELMGGCETEELPAGRGRRDWRGAGAVILTLLLGLQAVGDFAKPRWRYDDWSERRPVPEQPGIVDNLHHGVYAVLWLAGVAQSYRLFDWIESRNYHVRYKVRERRAGQPWKEVEASRLFPKSIRSILLQTYLYGVNWRSIPPDEEEALRTSLLERFAARYCRERPAAEIEVEAQVRIQRITAENARLVRGRDRPLMAFTCRAGEAYPGEPDPCAAW